MGRAKVDTRSITMWWLLAGALLGASAAPAAVAEPAAVTVDYSQAPAAQVEDLGVTAVGRTGGLALLGPSSDGKGTSAYICYYDHAFIRDPWEVVQVNLDTKEVKRYSSNRKEGLWNWLDGSDGRYYTYANSMLCRFDPKSEKIEAFGPASPDGSNYSNHWGADKKLYIGTYPNSRIIQFDPETTKFHDFGPQGPERKYPAYAYRITGDAGFIYTARGKQPWYLIALNIKTGEQTQLAEVSQEGDIELTRRDDVCYAILRQSAYAQGDKKEQRVRLEGAKMTAVDEIPAAKPEAKLLPRGHVALNGWEICRWSGYGAPDGMAEFWYRKEGGEWQSLKLTVGGTPARIAAMKALGDGRVVGSTDDPYSIWVFDPKANRTTVLGKAPSHTYDILLAGGKWYMSGYANAPLHMYDPAKAWTDRSQTPQGFAPTDTSPEANPRRVTDFNRAPFMQKWSPSIVLGADGRIYVGCKAEREQTGGALGWYDPKTNESGGLQVPFKTQAINQILAANDGKTILCSTYFAENPKDPKEGDKQTHIMAYDIARGAIVGDVIPIQGAKQYVSAGLMEWKPGKVIGTIAGPAGNGTLFFVLDTAAMKIESSALLSGPGASGPVLMEDGTLVGRQGKDLYKLDSATWTFRPLAKLPDAPRRMVAVGNDLYLAMGDHLMRARVK
jgi:hypothetical protein